MTEITVKSAPLDFSPGDKVVLVGQRSSAWSPANPRDVRTGTVIRTTRTQVLVDVKYNSRSVETRFRKVDGAEVGAGQYGGYRLCLTAEDAEKSITRRKLLLARDKAARRAMSAADRVNATSLRKLTTEELRDLAGRLEEATDILRERNDG
jgi:hypothetical protein